MKQVIAKIDRKFMLVFASGVIMGVIGLQFISIFDPTGKADKIKETMCSGIIMDCEIQKANCLGRLQRIEGI